MPIQESIDVLAKAPAILRDLMAQIPPEIQKVRRKPGKWSIHEHACHLGVAQKVGIERFTKFKNEERPAFASYIPGKTEPDTDLIDMKLEDALHLFETRRRIQLAIIETMTPEQWRRHATHPEYTDYSATILLRHMMMHDHFHMFRIEELWLTRDEYLGNP